MQSVGSSSSKSCWEESSEIDTGRYPENYVSISRLEVCQEGGYLEDIEGS